MRGRRFIFEHVESNADWFSIIGNDKSGEIGLGFIHLGREINNYMRAHLSGGKITGPRDHPERHMEMEMAWLALRVVLWFNKALANFAT